MLTDVYPNPDPAPFNRDVTSAPLKLDFAALQQLARDEGKITKTTKKREEQKKKREEQEKKREEKQQRERETILRPYIERMEAEEKARRDSKLANLEEDLEVNQRLRGLLQRLLETIPNGHLHNALRPSMSSCTTLLDLCYQYGVDTTGLQAEGVFTELKSVYNSL